MSAESERLRKEVQGIAFNHYERFFTNIIDVVNDLASLFGWHDSNKELPLVDVSVLIGTMNGIIYVAKMVRGERGNFCWETSDDGPRSIEDTFWMTIPILPVTKQKSEQP